MNPANRITIVADYDFRQGLAGFPEAEPVWIADTPGNRVIIEKAWKDNKNFNHLTGVTSYKTGESANPEDDVIGLLPIIEEHHGYYSHTPPYDAVLIYGVSRSEKLFKAFQDYGFCLHTESKESIEFRRNANTEQGR